MDTSSDAVVTDTLGRRIARQRHTRAEKRAMVEESLTSGVSVASVARRHELSSNQIFPATDGSSGIAGGREL
jgi:transposase-like protein